MRWLQIQRVHVWECTRTGSHYGPSQRGFGFYFERKIKEKKEAALMNMLIAFKLDPTLKKGNCKLELGQLISHFPYNFWSSYEYLFDYIGKECVISYWTWYSWKRYMACKNVIYVVFLNAWKVGLHWSLERTFANYIIFLLKFKCISQH